MPTTFDESREDARNRKAWWTIAIAALIASGVWAWAHYLRADTPPPPAAPTPSADFPWSRSGESLATSASAPASRPGRQSVESMLEVDDAGHLKVTRKIRTLFDSFLGQGEKEPMNTVRARILNFLNEHLPHTADQEARLLLDHYLAYGAAWQSYQLTTPNRTNSSDDRQARLYAIEGLRARYFSAPEREAFFGDDLMLERYTIERLQIMQDTTLSPIDKARMLKQLRAKLPRPQFDQLIAANIRADLDILTGELRARHGTQQDLRALREELMGVEGADQYETQQRNASARAHKLSSFNQQRQAILADPALSDPERQQAIEQLRQRLSDELEHMPAPVK